MALRGECHSQFPFSPAVLKLVDLSLYFKFQTQPLRVFQKPKMIATQ